MIRSISLLSRFIGLGGGGGISRSIGGGVSGGVGGGSGVNRVFTSQESQYNQVPVTGSVVNLGVGQPSPSLLPFDIISKSCHVQWCLRRNTSTRTTEEEDEEGGDNPLVLQYGVPRGHRDFLDVLADFLNFHQNEADAKELMLTNGNSQAILMATSLFCRNKGVVAVEDPTYFLAKGIFEQAGVSVYPIPMDHDGLNVDQLESDLINKKVKISLLYTIPIYHNPTGCCLSEERKMKLVSLAEKFDFVILSDEPYNFLSYDNNNTTPPSSTLKLRPKSLFWYDKGRGRVIVAGSFSKILAPGLRLGWIQADPHQIQHLSNVGLIQSGGGLNPFTAYSIQHALASGAVSEHISHLMRVYGTRRDVLCSSLEELLPEHCTFQKPSGGYFVWVRLRPPLSSSELLSVALRDFKIKFPLGKLFSLAPSSLQPSSSVGAFADHVRLSFAFYEEKELRYFVEQFQRAINTVLMNKGRVQ